MRIVHAVCDETGSARGGAPGDQTGREIREQEWYPRSGGWEQYIECTDASLAERAAEIAKAVAKGRYGYSQENRWSGYDSVLKNGVAEGCGDFDCSSLALSCYRLAGLAVKERSGSTADLAGRLTGTGKFALYTDAAHTGSAALAKKGSLYCTPGRHVILCVGDGAESEETERKAKKAPGGESVQTAGTRLRVKGSVRIREKPKTGKTVSVAHRGDVLEALGTDPETGWYRTPAGYVTNKERYVEWIRS